MDYSPESRSHERDNAGKTGKAENSINRVLLRRWAGHLGLDSLGRNASEANLSDLSTKLNDLYHDGERYIEFCLAISAARRLIPHRFWTPYVKTPGRFDFTLRTAQRRQKVGDVLLQLNATALSHFPRRAQTINKLARLGAAILLDLSESGKLRRERTVAEVDAMVQGYLGATEPTKHTIFPLIEKAADVARETHAEWTEQKFDRVGQALLDLMDLLRHLRTLHSEKIVRLAAVEPVESSGTANLITA